MAFSCPQVDLGRRSNQGGHAQAGVTAVAHFHKLGFINAVAYMGVVGLLICNSAEPCRSAGSWRVAMTDVNARVCRLSANTLLTVPVMLSKNDSVCGGGMLSQLSFSIDVLL
jgi:hypothetical protein